MKPRGGETFAPSTTGAGWSITADMRSNRSRWDARRSVFLALTLLALAIKIVVPQGFMVSAHGGSYSLVVCPGHMAQVSPTADHGGSHAPAEKKPDVPCAFAGVVAPPT